MRNRIERLRLWLVVSAGLLLAILIGFIGTARYLKRHALAQLGSRLGVDIRSETNGFTYSQSLQGRTVYTLHAAKEIEHSNGVIGLHDVSMTIYGRTGDRADMVYGNEFEYDKNAGEVRAIGLVHIDVGGAGSATPGSAAARLLAQGHDDPNQGAKVLHATTSGLVYLDKLGVAATKEPIEFVNGQLTGHAVGADYSTDTGTLLLHSAVNIAGSVNSRPVTLTAAAAQIDNRGQRAVLAHAHFVSTDESIEANQVILHSRPDNSLERIEAEGDIRISQRGAQLNAKHADLALTGKNKVEKSVFTGGAQYTRDEPLRQARGEAQQIEVTFDPEGAPLHAVFQGTVHMIERSRSTEDAKQPWAVHDLVADHVETALSATTPGKSEVRELDAAGNARLTVVDNGSASSRGRGTTDLAGETLTAHLLPTVAPSKTPRLDTLLAQGHTSIRQLSTNGIEQTSTGDTLNARFRPAPAPTGRKPQPAAGAEELASAVQSGHVRMTRKAAPKPSTQPGAGAVQTTEEPQEATADRAVYDGDTDRVTLTGGVRLQQTDTLLLSDQLAFERTTGDAHAEGAVRVSYTQPPAAATQAARDPVHVLADRADMNHATDLASFYGRPARMWQGASQLQAPVLELSRQQRTVSAHGDPKGSYTSGPVQTILINARAASENPVRLPAAHTGTIPPPAPSSTKTPQIIRVLSRDLLYAELDRKAQFGGPVQIESGGETIHARSATAYLQPAISAPAKPAASGPAVSLDGHVDRVIANGDVTVEQPGRRATGERLLYVAEDSSVLLTGSPVLPPKVLDTDRGTTVTAFAFRLHTGDESVEALSSLPDDAARERVRTETPARR